MALRRISGRGFVKYVEVEDSPEEVVLIPEETLDGSPIEVEEDWKEDGFPEEEYEEPE